MNPDKDDKNDHTLTQPARSTKDENATINFLINAVKSQEDSIRQIMSLNGLVLGVYVTVIANNYSKIPGAYIPPLQFTIELTKMIYVSIPAVIWIISLILAITALHPTALHPTAPTSYDNERMVVKLFKIASAALKSMRTYEPTLLPDNENTKNFLIKLINYKQRQFKLAASILIFGFVAVFYGAMMLSYSSWVAPH